MVTVVQCAEIATAVGLVIYVIYTARTFKQIKKQTDHMLKAHLYVENKIVDSIVTSDFIGKKTILVSNYINPTISSEWKKFLHPFFGSLGSNILDGRFFTLIFTNYSNTVVRQVCISVKIKIQHSEKVRKELNQNDRNGTMDFVINEFIRPDNPLAVQLFSTASFPKYQITITGTYIDIYDNNYDLTSISCADSSEYLLELPPKPKIKPKKTDDLPF